MGGGGGLEVSSLHNESGVYRVFLALLAHGQRSVGQLIVLGLLRFHGNGVRPGPVFTVYDWPQHPQLVCPVMKH